MRKCSYCGKECSEDLIFCPIDQTPLVAGASESFIQTNAGFDFNKLQLKSIWHTRIIGIFWMLVGLPGFYTSFTALAHDDWALITNAQTDLFGLAAEFVVTMLIFSFAFIIVGYGILRFYLWARILCRILAVFFLVYALLMFLSLLMHWDKDVWLIFLGDCLAILFFIYSFIGLGYKRSLRQNSTPQSAL